MAYTVNGPRAGRGTRRANNTLAHNASKTSLTPPSGAGGAVPPPPVSPDSAAAYAGQMSALQLQLAQRLAAGRAQRGILQGQFRMDKAGIRADEIAGLSAAEGDAADRGVLGSSADLQQRIGVQSQAAAGVNQAIQSKVQGILGIKLDRIAATNDYYTGVFDIAARKAAEQANAANQAFLQDLVMRLGDETAPGGPGGRFGRGGGASPVAGIPTDTSVGGNNFPYPQQTGPNGIPTDTSVGGNNSTNLQQLLAQLRKALAGMGG